METAVVAWLIALTVMVGCMGTLIFMALNGIKEELQRFNRRVESEKDLEQRNIKRAVGYDV